MSINTDNENLLRAVPNMLPFTIPPLVIDGDFANLYLRQILGIYPIAGNVGQAEQDFKTVVDPDQTSSAEFGLNTIADPNSITIADPNLASIADPNIDSIAEQNLLSVADSNINSIAESNIDTIDEDNLESIDEDNLDTVPDNDFDTVSRRD